MKKRLISMLMATIMLLGAMSGITVMADTEDAVSTVGWAITGTDKAGSAAYSAGISTAEANSGNKSMHITFAPTAAGEYLFIRPDTELDTFGNIGAGTYKVTAYVKRVTGTGVAFGGWFGWGRTAITGTTAGAWEQVSVEGVYTADSNKRFLIVLQANGALDATDLYIDDIVIEKDGVEIYRENFGDDVVEEEPDDTTAEDISTVGWVIKPNNPGSSTYAANITSMEAKTGSKSMHITFDPTAAGEYIFIRPDADWTILTAGSTYTVTAYVKRIKGTGIAFGGWLDNYARSAFPATAIGEWEKVEYTGTCSDNSNKRFLFQLQANGDLEPTELYIDDIVVKQGNKIIFNESFGDSTYPTVTAPAETADFVNWSTSSVFKTAVDASNAYSGERSLYINTTPDNGWKEISAETTKAIDSTKTYDISLYAKGNPNVPIYVMMGGGAGSIFISSLSVEVPEDAAKASEGWLKYVGSFTSRIEHNLKIAVNTATANLYIDNITLCESGTTENILINGDFEKVIKPALPDITAQDISVAQWQIATNSSPGSAAYTTNISSRDANSGKKSMHLTFTPTAGGEYLNLRPTDANLGNLTVGTKYTVTAYIKRVTGTGAGFTGWKEGYGSDSITGTSLGEWEQVTVENVCGAESHHRLLILLQAQGGDLGKTELYIDDIVLKANDIVVWTEDFEDTTSGIKTFGADVFDEDMNKVTELTSDLSGKTVTAAATVANYDTDSTAQLLIGVYRGTQLVACELSEIVNATKTGAAANVEAEITLPEFTDGDDISIKVFIWDSFDGMYPYTTVKEIK